MNFIPPKADLDIEDIGKVLDISFKLGFLDDILILEFLQLKQNMLANVNFSKVIYDCIENKINSLRSDLLISCLQSIFWHYGEKNDTGFLIYSIHYILAKQKYPEMMSFAYKNLLMESEMMEKFREIVINLKAKVVLKIDSK